MPEPVEVDVEFGELLQELTQIDDLDATWLQVATRLLSFCHKHPIPASAWLGLSGGEVESIVQGIETLVYAELLRSGNVQGSEDASSNEIASDTVHTLPPSFATQDQLLALQTIGKSELSAQPFSETRLSVCVVARGLAGAIDHLAGETFLEWFRNHSELVIEEGRPYPVIRHDPRRWLGTHPPNTNPARLQSRDLDATPHLKIASQHAGFRYVIDFGLWNRLSPIGSYDGLIVAVGQPNLHLSEFGYAHPGNPPTIANHGPLDNNMQIDRIKRLVEEATRHAAQIILLPEYSLSETVSTQLVQWLPQLENPPVVFCAGHVGGPDADGYVENESFLLVNTPGTDRGWTQRSNAKTTSAVINGLHERIRLASDVRLYASAECTLGVLVCVDAMNNEVIDRLADLGTNLLLVPAMSPKTATMVGTVIALCSRSQGFIALANGPASWTHVGLDGDAPTTQEGESALQMMTEGLQPPVAGSSDYVNVRCEAFFAGPYGSDPASWRLPSEGYERPEGRLSLRIFNTSTATVDELTV